MSYVKKRVGDFLTDEAVFLYGVKDQVEWVKDELLVMQCFLKDADAKSRGDDRAKNWARHVREIAYQTDDLVESFVLVTSSFALVTSSSTNSVRRSRSYRSNQQNQ